MAIVRVEAVEATAVTVASTPTSSPLTAACFIEVGRYAAWQGMVVLNSNYDSSYSNHGSKYSHRFVPAVVTVLAVAV
jgi:hypothetical protein